MANNAILFILLSFKSVADMDRIRIRYGQRTL